MRYGVSTISFVLFFSACTNCIGQQENKYIFRHIDQSDGLLHNLIFSIGQDSRGFIWILTPNGMQRYDGASFVNYLYDINDPGAIPYISESRFFTDRKNNQLYRVSHGIEKFDPLKNKFIAANDEQLIKGRRFSFEEYLDSLNNRWLAGTAGVFRFAKNSTTPAYVTGSYFVPGQSGSFSMNASGNEAWLTGWPYGLLLFDKKTRKVCSPKYNPIHHPLLQQMSNAGLTCVFVDSYENIWLASNGESFYRYDPLTKKIATYSLAHIRQRPEKNKTSDAALLVNCFFEDNHHVLWIGTRNAGLLSYNREKDAFIPVAGEKEDQQHIRYNYNIGCIYQDHEENIWLGTDKGINIFNPYRQHFQSVYHDDNNPLSLPKNELQQCIETPNGNILVATWGGGISVFDNQWHFKKTIRFPDIPREYNLTWCFVQNDDGTIWTGCQHGYIHIYDPVKETIQSIHPPEMNNFTIRCMAKDKKGNIFFGLYDGKIVKWDKAQRKFYGYNEKEKAGAESFSQVFTLFIDSKQRCWAGCEFGLKEFDPVKMIYTNTWLADKKKPYSISANTVQVIEELNDSTLAIGTVYGGLNFFNTQSNKFTHLDTHDGLPSNTINNLKKDDKGNLWFTTDYGLYKYIPGPNKIIHYTIDPGIVNSTFTRGNLYQLKDGRWLAKTETEIISFHPDSLQKKQSEGSKVYITGFRVFDKPMLIDSLLNEGKAVKLSYKQNFLSIEYKALGFSRLPETKYYYRLSGVDKDWVAAGPKRVASYTGLGPGEYTFSVRTGDEDDSQPDTSFTIVVTPPLWKTVWFRVLLLALAGAVVYFLFRKRIKTIRHEAGMKQKIAETEMMALRAQMNPHFIFNCINSIDAMIQSNDKYHATMYLNKFAKLIRNILDSSKQNLVPLSKDIETLKLYVELEQFRNENKFKAEINADDELLLQDYQVPPLIIQPYVENAILHGLRHRSDNNGKLTITIQKQDGALNYEITDNGVGRKTTAGNGELNKNRNSYGMQIGNDRVRLFNQEELASVQVTDLKEDNKPAGTRVTIQLKMQ
ncbi:MAG: ligand-binding sensor domain-containing protein [Bacteroidota bacterium]